MLRFRFFSVLVLIFTLNACVKPKIYQAELVARNSAESREKVLVQELLDRKKETTDLTRQVGELNRTIGNQEAEIKDLNTEISARTQQMGESSSKLLSEKTTLENELAAKNAELFQRNALLQRIQKAQQERKKILKNLNDALIKSYEGQSGVTIFLNEETVLLSLPDKALFEAKGLEISASGKKMLASLAAVLTARPNLDVDIICFTDNALPKDKTLQDTWDWSLRRAVNAVRVLISDYNVNANQMTPVGRGEFYPITSNETAEGRQKNRRTEVVLRPVLPVVPDAE